MPMPVEPLVVEVAPRVDGVLDEVAWAAATPVTGLVGYVPSPGAADPGQTDVRFLSDARALYVGVRVKRSGPLNAPMVPRDDTLFNDWVGLVFDTFRDGQRAFTFRVTPRGVQADGVYTEGNDFWMQDLSWDAVWESAGTINATEWTAEVAIPWRSLRYSASADAQDWRVVVSRFQPSPWTLYTWPEVEPDDPNLLVEGADLRVRPPPPAGIPVEVIPTLTSSYTTPATSGHGLLALEPVPGWTVDPGVSGRVGISSGLTLDLAVNPDFSQVESDADQVTANLKGPLELKEKRPFFLESADLFGTPLGLVYSRSIVDPLVGTKLSGRVGKLGLGLIAALDERPTASTLTDDYATGKALPGWDEATVDGRMAVDSLARGRLGFGEGGSVGVLVADKELVGAGRTLGNHVFGVDAVVPIGEEWESEAQVATSVTELSDGSVLIGPAWEVGFERSGDVVSFEIEQGGVSEDFRAETGFVEEVGRIGAGGMAAFHIRDLSWSRSVDPNVHAEAVTDFSGQLTGVEAGAGWEAFVGKDGYTEGRVDYVRERFLGVDFDRWNVRGFAAASPTPTTNIWVDWDVGATPNYNAESAAETYLGFAWQPSAGATVSLFERATVDYTFVYYRFGRDAFSDAELEGTLNRLKLTVNISPPVSIRLIEEYNAFEDTLDSSLLLGWQKNYATAVWLGGQESRSVVTGEAEHGVFGKVSVLFRN